MQSSLVIAIKNDDGDTTHYCGIFEDLSEKKIAEREIQIQMNTDTLTGSENSYSFMNRMNVLLEASEKKNFEHALLFLDMDRFSHINELGHSIGDKLLTEVVQRLTPFIRNKDILARYGGDEFIILLPNTTVEEAAVVAENLRQQLANSNSPCGRPVTLSAGVAEYPKMASTTEALIEAADGALYLAKQAGRNQVKTAGEK